MIYLFVANTLEVLKNIIEENLNSCVFEKRKWNINFRGKFQRERKLVKISKYLVARTPS